MIKLIKYGKELNEIFEHIVKPTIFPDATSQIWKLPENMLYFNQFAEIHWEFENESELFQVLQLAELVNRYNPNHIGLIIPYLPYGRQDKEVSNDKTFALSVFIDTLEKSKLFTYIITKDAHNPNTLRSIRNDLPNDVIQEIITKIKPDIICFPDKGASQRGYTVGNIATINLDKTRDNLTGRIEGLKYEGSISLKDCNILILDDICDGGGTFIGATKLLKDLGANEVSLFTTHGIYSKGTQILFDNGIDRVFNCKGEVLNEK